MIPVRIIVPTFRHERLTIECLGKIREYTRYPYSVHIVDDGSPPQTSKTVLTYLKRSFSGCWSYTSGPKENAGPATMINSGIVQAIADGAEYAVILNNDVQVTECWLIKLVEALESFPKIALIGAIMDYSSSICQYQRAAKKAGASTPFSVFASSHFNALPMTVLPVSTNVSYSCVLMRTSIVEKIGLLDERFFCGGEDDDYNDRIRKAGFQTAICVNCFVSHHHHASINLIPDMKKRKMANIALLNKKREERKRNKKH